jgi:hypothetical protein
MPFGKCPLVHLLSFQVTTPVVAARFAGFSLLYLPLVFTSYFSLCSLLSPLLFV